MSNTDSFIDEVAEEVRRDRMLDLLRRYGWIAALAVIALVGGTGWNEYRKAQLAAQAQARGDAISASLREATPEARANALNAESGVVEAFLAASEFQAAGNVEDASATLATLSKQVDLPPLYRDLAQIKRLSVDPDIDATERALILSALAAPGAPYRTVARELIAIDQISAGDTEEALDAFQAILQDADASPAQRTRVAQIIIALGGTPELANILPGGSPALPSE